MRIVSTLLMLTCLCLTAQAQVRPDLQPTKAPQASDAIYTQEGNGTIPAGEIRKIKFAQAREYFLALVNPTCISAAPPALSATSIYKGQYVTICSNNYVYYVDGAGRSKLVYQPGAGGSYTAGAGIAINGAGIISNIGDANASDDITTATAQAGDLSGSLPNALVDGLQGRPIASTAPTSGQSLKWNGSQWAPAVDLGESTTVADGSTIDFTQTGVAITAEVKDNSIGNAKVQNASLTLNKLAQTAATTGQVIKWNGSQWAPAVDAGGSTSGESTTVTDGSTIDFTLTGSDVTAEVKDNSLNTSKYIDASVTAAKLAQNGAANGQVMKWNGSAWAAGDDTGAAYTQGTGISISGTVITNTGDLSATNEIQTLSAGTNTLSLSAGGGTVNVDTDAANDLLTSSTFSGDVSGTYNATTVIKWAKKAVTATVGQTSFTVTGSQPPTLQRVRVYRNGLEQTVGTSGTHILYSAGTYSFTRATASGEQWVVYFQE